MDDLYNSRWTGEQIDDAVALARQGSIITGAEATTLAAGSAATAAVESNVLRIGVPVGADGVSATHSWNGTVLSITSASGTSSADLKGAKGDTGDPGYTPVKGTDYWTAADKQEMVNEVLAALPAAEGVGF